MDRLNNLCYFAQVWSIVWRDEPMFSEKFVVGDTSPVCEELEKCIVERIKSGDKNYIGNANLLSFSEKKKGE